MYLIKLELNNEYEYKSIHQRVLDYSSIHQRIVSDTHL